MLWVVLQGVATRGIGILQQLALAWLLTRDDFGLITLALTVSTFVTLLANPGIDSVLVQRQRRLRQWVTPAFWMAMMLGFAGMVVMLIAAPLAALVYGQPQVVGLIMVMAFAAPLQALQVIPRATLQAHLRFRAIVGLTTLNYALTAVISVLLACFGFGAYSFAIPVPLAAGAVSALAWYITRPAIHRHPHFGWWRYLLGDSAAVGGTQFVNTLVNQGDYICLGLAGVASGPIGVYAFAFRLSTQSFSILANVVPAVLFPSLSQLVLDPERQVRAAMRGTRLIALVTIPFCLLQILLARPAIALFCRPDWLDSVLPLQILTVGMMINAPCWPASSLLMAQRRFSELFRVALHYGVVFFVMVVGALVIHGGIVAVAIAVMLWHLWASAYVFWVGVRPALPWYGYYSEIYRPLLAGVMSLTICAGLASLFPSGRIGDAVMLIAMTLTYSVIYTALIRTCAASDFLDLLAQLEPISRRIRGAFAT